MEYWTVDGYCVQFRNLGQLKSFLLKHNTIDELLKYVDGNEVCHFYDEELLELKKVCVSKEGTITID